MGSKLKKILIYFLVALMLVETVPVIEADAATWTKTGSSTNINKKKTKKTVTKKYRTEYKATTSWEAMSDSEKTKYKKKTKGTTVVDNNVEQYNSSTKNYSKKYTVNFGTKKKKKNKTATKKVVKKYYNVTATQYNFKTKKKRTVTFKRRIITTTYNVVTKKKSTDSAATNEKYSDFKMPFECSKLTTSSKVYKLTQMKGIIPDNLYKSYSNMFGTKFTISKKECTSKGVLGIFKHAYGIVLKDKKQSAGTAIHEMGHFHGSLSYYCDRSEEWHELFWAYRDDAKSFYYNADYTCATPGEFYAETFAYMMIYPSKVKRELPEIYAYMVSKLEDTPNETDYPGTYVPTYWDSSSGKLCNACKSHKSYIKDKKGW